MGIPQEKEERTYRLILLYKGLKDKASVPTDDLIPKTRRFRNQHSMAFQTPPGFSCWLSSAPVFQWCCSTPQGSLGVGRNTFLSSPHFCFIIVYICDLFVSSDDPLMS